MKYTVNKKGAWRVLILLLTVITMAIIVLLLPYINEHKTNVEPISFLGTYQLNDGAPPQPLTDNTYIDACENSAVILRGTLSRPLKKDTQLLFFMEYMEVHIYINNEDIYSWGDAASRPAIMRSSGAAWGHCVLPTSIMPGDEVTISLESKYSNNYNSAYHNFLNSLQTGDSGALARVVLTKNWPYLLIGLMLFLTGLTLLLFILSLSRQGVTLHSSIHYCAYFVLSASFWMSLAPEYSTLVFDNAPLIMLLETIFMWLFSTFLIGYFGTFMQSKAKQANDMLMFGFAAALLLFIILQLMGITDAYAVRDLHNIILAVVAVVFLFVFLYELRHSKQSKICTLALPGLIYAAFGIGEMLNYEFEWVQRGAVLAVGFTLFIAAQFIFAVQQIRDSLLMALRTVSLEKDLTESRTAVMLSQIQPHFLYNALTGIKVLCSIDPERAEDAMEHFSFFLRGNLDSLSDTRLITFGKEISHVNDYIYLEKMRFNDRVKLVLELEFQDFMIPPLTLQPLVENAIRYGITQKDSGGTVTIRTYRQAGQIYIIIADDGVGFDVGASKDDGRSHTGIENVSARLKMQCNGSLSIVSEKTVGTVVRIILPGKEWE